MKSIRPLRGQELQVTRYNEGDNYRNGARPKTFKFDGTFVTTNAIDTRRWTQLLAV